MIFGEDHITHKVEHYKKWKVKIDFTDALTVRNLGLLESIIKIREEGRSRSQYTVLNNGYEIVKWPGYPCKSVKFHTTHIGQIVAVCIN